MTLIHNTTNLKESLIRIISELVIPPDIPPISEISLRNKMEGATHGNWGKFYGNEYAITLCVPQFMKDYDTIRVVTRKQSSYKDRYDFLAAILGHEYHHAWQWIHEKDLWHCKEYLEVQCERYEPVALMKWVDWREKNNIKYDEQEAVSQAATKSLKYKDFR